jgi:hypothetical protein
MIFGSRRENMIDRFLHKNFLKAALVGSCFLFLSCENDQKVFDEWTKDKQMIEEGKNIETLISEGSHMKARLTAPHMIRYMSDTVYVEFPKTLKVDFYNVTGAVESHLNSKYGKYFETMNRVLLRDSVVAYNFQGDTLHTQELSRTLVGPELAKNLYKQASAHPQKREPDLWYRHGCKPGPF